MVETKLTCPSGLRGHVKAVICSHAWVQTPQSTLLKKVHNNRTNETIMNHYIRHNLYLPSPVSSLPSTFLCLTGIRYSAYSFIFLC